MIESNSEPLQRNRRGREASPRLARTAGRSYDEDVALLRKQLLRLCDVVADQVAAGIRSVLERDRELAGQVIEGDREVDGLELEVRPPLHPLPDLERLWDLCQKQLRAAFASLVAADVGRAQRTIANDEP